MNPEAQQRTVNIEIGASDGQNTVVVKGDVKEGDQVITDQAVRNG